MLFSEWYFKCNWQKGRVMHKSCEKYFYWVELGNFICSNFIYLFINFLYSKWSSSVFGKTPALGMIVFSDYKQEFCTGHLCILVWPATYCSSAAPRSSHTNCMPTVHPSSLFVSSSSSSGRTGQYWLRRREVNVTGDGRQREGDQELCKPCLHGHALQLPGKIPALNSGREA